MKKLFLSLVMMISSMVSFAQYEPGTFSIRPEVGFNVSKLLLSGATQTGYGFGESYNKLGFVVGAEADYQANEWFGVSAGLLYSQMGANGKSGLDIKINYDYIAVPILANFYVWKGLCMKTGIQPAFCINSKATEKGDNIINWGGDYTRKFDIQVPVGFSYEIGGFIVDARYNVGIVNILKNQPTSMSFRNSVTQITLGYKFHL